MKKYNTIFKAFADISDKEKHNIALVVAKNKTIIGEVKEVYKCTDLDPILQDVRLLAENTISGGTLIMLGVEVCACCERPIKTENPHPQCSYHVAQRILAATEEEL